MNKDRQKEFFRRQIEEKEKRKLAAREEKKRSEWRGFGLFGTIGWSIVVPTLLGTALGRWIDKSYPDPYSWTLTFLIIGLLVGCIIAAYWVRAEHREMHNDKQEKNE